MGLCGSITPPHSGSLGQCNIAISANKMHDVYEDSVSNLFRFLHTHLGHLPSTGADVSGYTDAGAGAHLALWSMVAVYT